jgi:hypothetical protein
MRISLVVLLTPTQAFSVRFLSQNLSFGRWSKGMLLTAISENGTTTVSDEGESSGKAGGSSGAGKTGDGSDRKLHFEYLMIARRRDSNGFDSDLLMLKSRRTLWLYRRSA